MHVLYIRLHFGGALVGYMFQKKIDEWFYDTLNVFFISDIIVIAGAETDSRNNYVMFTAGVVKMWAG